ncbi:MAG: acyl-CoA thioesterase [Chloroflexi bacterium]|nr:acyl-CoA thioesterase [Chloroflexota bacterium]
MNHEPYHIIIPVRYGDLDAQGHVNNARFASYMEQARLSYILHLGLWDGKSFTDLPFIVADVHITYRSPIKLGQSVVAYVWATHIGNKSLKLEYRLEDQETRRVFAVAETVMVAYDYLNERSVPLTRSQREIIASFEGLLLENPS